MKNYRLVLASVLLLLASCSNKDEQQDTQTGELMVNMVADQTIISRADGLHQEPTLKPDMFTMDIQNPEGEPLKSWSYTDMPKPLRLSAGSYRMVAWYGSKELPAWNTPYYKGQVDFTIKKGEQSSTDILCKPAAVKVQVVFDESFTVRYSAYAVRIRTGAQDAKYLTFTPETHGQAGYFAEGDLRMLFALTSKVDGTVAYYDANLNVQAKAKESYIYRVTAKVIQGFDVLTITTDESTIDKEPIDIIIPNN